MSIVTTLWCMNAAFALTLADVCLLFWLVERRDLMYLVFCVVAASTAVSIPFELAMMHATTAAEYGELLRWYHLPVFFVLVGYPFFVRYYLGTGRQWLLWAIVVLRLAALAVNFVVDPNINFREIKNLQQVSFLGDQISVVGERVMRQTQWLATSGVLLIVAFVVDAAIQSFRKVDTESRRKALIVGAALLVPLVGAAALNLLVTSGVLHLPISNTIWFLGTLSVIAYDLGREVILNRRAQRQLARLKSDLARLDRVNTLGQFASGLAHELIQPLAATASNAAAAEMLLKQEAPDLGEFREIVGDILKDTARASDTIHHMRLMIQHRATERKLVDLRAVVRDALLLAKPEAISRNVAFDVRMPPELPRAFCDPVQVSQVLLNLLANAMDAVNDCPRDARRVDVEARVGDSGGLEVAISDSGPGIPAGNAEEVFNPLFTTKPDGLGMGLAISRTIIEEHGGRLWATNSPATGGALFRFTLPHAEFARGGNEPSALYR